MKETLPPQPPSDAPGPRASDSALMFGWKMWVLLAIGLGLIAIIILLITPIFSRSRTICDMTDAIFKARQIGIALSDFESEYGKFPDASTVAEVKRASGTPLTLAGDSSNDFFAQLIAAGICTYEPMFYTKAKGAVKPDGSFDSDATALSHGECSFAYFAGLDVTGNPSRPLAFGPVIPGTQTLDIESNDGKAVFLNIDGSVTSRPINSAGKVIVGGMDLLDPRNLLWDGKPPEVKWPK